MLNYNRILLIQTAFLGDAILTTPLVRAMKQTYPEAEIDILIIPETAIVFKNNPYIRNIIIYDKRSYINRTITFLTLISKLRQNNYDLAVSTQLSMTTSLIMLLSGIKNRLGFPRQKLLSMTINLPKGISIVNRYLRLMTALTPDKFCNQTELFWDDATDNEVSRLAGNYLATHENVIGIAPGSVWETKRWLPEYYSELIRKLIKNNIKCILIGGKDDSDLCSAIADNSDVNPLNLAGQLSILGSAALIKRLKLIISNDSAPLHIANAVKTKVIAIFGPTVKRFGFYPFGENDKVLEIDLNCRPCGKHGGKKCPQKHFSCMKSIEPDTVLNVLLESLER